MAIFSNVPHILLFTGSSENNLCFSQFFSGFVLIFQLKNRYEKRFINGWPPAGNMEENVVGGGDMDSDRFSGPEHTQNTDSKERNWFH